VRRDGFPFPKVRRDGLFFPKVRRDGLFFPKVRREGFWRLRVRRSKLAGLPEGAAPSPVAGRTGMIARGLPGVLLP